MAHYRGHVDRSGNAAAILIALVGCGDGYRALANIECQALLAVVGPDAANGDGGRAGICVVGKAHCVVLVAVEHTAVVNHNEVGFDRFAAIGLLADSGDARVGNVEWCHGDILAQTDVQVGVAALLFTVQVGANGK